VNAVAPGWVLTDRQKELWVTPESLAAHLARQCLPDPIEPADMGGAVLFLASEASRMMTSQTLILDGGFIAG
jgi:NAD(P)-dependent dehydrogenase (short-subunit alcohol dehydrogenase family)